MARDDGDLYRCELCGSEYPDRGSALKCCSRVAIDGGRRSVGGWILVPGDVWEATVAFDGYTYETLCGVEISDWITWQEEQPESSEAYEVCIECLEAVEVDPELVTHGGRPVDVSADWHFRF